MTNPEDIFSHLPPADRPDATPLEKEPSFMSDQERMLVQLAGSAIALMPQYTGKHETPTHYTDYDRGAYIIERARERGVEITHEDAMRALTDADEKLVERRQAAIDLRARTDNWHEYGVDREHLTGQDQRDLIRLHQDETLTPQDILPEEPNQEAHND